MCGIGKVFYRTILMVGYAYHSQCMHKDHKKIIQTLKQASRPIESFTSSDSYILSGHFYYNVPVPVRRQIAKDYVKENKEISFSDFVSLLTLLYEGVSHEEKTIASYLLTYYVAHRKKITPKHLDTWLRHLVGWAEIDALCYNVFTAEEMLCNWQSWEVFLTALMKDKNINKRRASLVFLAGPAHRSSDSRLREKSFTSVQQLKTEPDIIITKAISWLLREMVKQHKVEVEKFLDTNESTLPRIAVRETRRKIATGKK